MSTCRWSLSRGGVGALIGSTVVVTAATVGVIEDIGASAPTAIGYRPYRRYGAVGAAAGYGGCGPYSYYDRYSGVCRPSGGYYGPRGVYGARVYRGRGYAYRGYRGGYRGGVYRGRAVAVRGGYGRGFARGRR